jgi:hypothetical protein
MIKFVYQTQRERKMANLKPLPMDYDEILRNVKRGIYQIPKFQRNFVWEKEKVAQLMDSIFKGYPIGSFILWKTKERLGAIKGLGSKIFPDIPDGDSIYYILDGQQRITSLYLVVEGVKIEKVDYSQIYIDLKNAREWVADTKSDCEVILPEKPDHPLFLSIRELMGERISKLRRKLLRRLEKEEKKIDEEELEDIIEESRARVKDYKFSIIQIEEMPLERVIEVFTRINTSGKTLTLFEIMNAKIYQEGKFDLEEKFTQLIDELKDAGYETIGENRTLILQLIGLILKKSAKKKVILSLSKDEFIGAWSDATKSLKLAIDKIRTYLRIPVSKLLPYYILVVPFAYFYYINRFREPTLEQLKELEKYFFRSAFSWRFSSAVESKLTSDIKIIENIKENRPIQWEKEIPVDDKETLKEWLKWDFSPSNAFDKGVLAILAYFQPKRFNDNSDILLDNSWLTRSTSKNYHHFFPKGFLLKKRESENPNALANITLVDDYLNKRKIKAKAPSKYIGEFAKKNPHIKETLKTHLIDDIEEFGILSDDYKLFLEKRSDRIVEEILKRI